MDRVVGGEARCPQCERCEARAGVSVRGERWEGRASDV